MLYLLSIKYDGKNYYGWSPQPNNKTIFQEVEIAAKKVFKEKIKIRSSGRTDRYVHALNMPITIKTLNNLEPSLVLKEMNKSLPNDIKVISCEFVSDNFEVRYNVKEKRYRYLINLDGDGDRDYFWNWTYKFDLEKLIKISKEFIGKKNFQSFTGKRVYENYVREVYDIKIDLKEEILTIDVIGKGFLRFMVRNIVGAMMAENRGIINIENIREYFKNPQTGKSHYKAPGSGLYLVDVLFI